MILTYKYDPDRVKINHHAKNLGQKAISFEYHCPDTQTPRYNLLVALHSHSATSGQSNLT